MIANIRLSIYSLVISIFLFSCHSSRKTVENKNQPIKKNNSNKKIPDSNFESKIKIKKDVQAVSIDTKNVDPDDVIAFSKTLLGIPYKYGSCDKEKGFDCSGFIWYVFNHFKIKVPRTSIDYTNAGKQVKPKDSKKGDIILFTGSDKTSGKVGHLGMIIQNNDDGFLFIHSANGGVKITGMNSYYYDRFVKVVRIFR